MSRQAVFNAIISLAMMAAVVGVYVATARRYRYLWHPLSILAAVTIVGVVVAVLGEWLFGSGSAGVPTMLRRSLIGGLGWGLVIALSVSACRWAYRVWTVRR